MIRYESCFKLHGLISPSIERGQNVYSVFARNKYFPAYYPLLKYSGPSTHLDESDLLFEDKAQSKNDYPYGQSHNGNEKSTCLIDMNQEKLGCSIAMFD